MRKFYFLLVAMVTMLAGLSASANKTITFKTNVEDAIALLDPSNSYTSVVITVEGVSITVSNNATIPLSANSGFMMSRVEADNGIVFSTSPTQSTTVDATPLSNGSVVTVTVIDESLVPKKEFTLVGTPGSYYISYNYENIEPDANGVIKRSYETWNSISVYAKEGYKLKDVVEQGGGTYTSSNDYVYIYCGNFVNTAPVLNVNTINKADIVTSKFKARVEGSNPYKVSFRRQSNSNEIELSKEFKEIEFEEGERFSINCNYYGQALYKVEVNGVALPSNGGSWSYSPSANDELVIFADFPDMNVPFVFDYADGVGADFISSMRINNNAVDASQWSAGEMQVKLGSLVELTFNKDYLESTATLNGNVIYTSDNYYNGYTFTVADENGYTLSMTGKRMTPYTVTVVVADPSWVKLCKGYTENTYTLTGQVSEIEVSRSDNMINFKANDGYKVMGISVDGVEYESFYGYYYVNSDCEIEIDVVELKRDMTAVLYLEPYAWNYKSFVLSSNDSSVRKEYAPESGYNFYNYGSFDVPFMIGAYPTPVVYLNDEVIENVYGAYPALEGYQEGDVIKLFHQTPSTHVVNYDIDADVAVGVVHDHVRSVENPSSHDVLPGTEVHIIPMATFAVESPTPAVTVNGTKVEADEDGKFKFTVNGNTDVKVTKSVNGISDIAVDDENISTTVYNLQGIKLGESTDNLPAGLYIVGGKKVVIK